MELALQLAAVAAGFWALAWLGSRTKSPCPQCTKWEQICRNLNKECDERLRENCDLRDQLIDRNIVK